MDGEKLTTQDIPGRQHLPEFGQPIRNIPNLDYEVRVVRDLAGEVDYWDGVRDLALNALVHATGMRVHYAALLRDQEK